MDWDCHRLEKESGYPERKQRFHRGGVMRPDYVPPTERRWRQPLYDQPHYPSETLF